MSASPWRDVRGGASSHDGGHVARRSVTGHDQDGMSSPAISTAFHTSPASDEVPTGRRRPGWCARLDRASDVHGLRNHEDCGRRVQSGRHRLRPCAAAMSDTDARAPRNFPELSRALSMQRPAGWCLRPFPASRAPLPTSSTGRPAPVRILPKKSRVLRRSSAQTSLLLATTTRAAGSSGRGPKKHLLQWPSARQTDAVERRVRAKPIMRSTAGPTLPRLLP